LDELYRITKDGGSFFYGHKLRWDRDGIAAENKEILLKVYPSGEGFEIEGDAIIQLLNLEIKAIEQMNFK
jgi:hypothetical protein